MMDSVTLWKIRLERLIEDCAPVEIVMALIDVMCSDIPLVQCKEVLDNIEPQIEAIMTRVKYNAPLC